MKKLTRILSLLLVLTMAAGMFATAAHAKSAAPVSISVNVNTKSTGYNGIITVTVTVKNTSSKDVNNIVVSSSDSKGLCMYRPIDYNVAISNPGSAKPVLKKDAMTACLKPGGTMKYVYCVLLGYQYAKNKVSETTRVAMLQQHKLLGTKNFRTVKLSAPSQAAAGYLTFGDIKTLLYVKAYYNVSNAVYQKIAQGSSVSQSTAANTKASSTGKTSGSSSSGKSGVDPDFKAFWDSYVDLMNNPGTGSAYLRKYADFTEKADRYMNSESELTPEEVAYMYRSLEKIGK